MKKILFVLTVCCVATFYYSCDDDAYDNIKKYVSSEIIYPEKFDTISAAVGFERVEIYLTRAGRSDSIKYDPYKATKTIVEYDNIKKEYDGMVSWLNVDGLDLAKLYRFKVYTIDKYGNQSVPQEISCIPFTKEDRDAIVIADPKTILSPWGISFSWPSGLSSSGWNFVGCDYSFKDKDGKDIVGFMEEGGTLRFDATNLEPGSQLNLKFDINVLPILDEALILDTINFSQTIEIDVPTVEEYGQFLTSREIKSWSNDGEKMTINWADVSDYTMVNSTLTYWDRSDRDAPVLKEIKIENTETSTNLPGLILEYIDIYSTYEPVGGEGALVDAKTKQIKPEFADANAMAANGINKNTDPFSVTKLTYPIHSDNFLDILYFPNVTEVDFTGGGATIPTYTSTGNNVSNVVGGVPWNFGFQRRDYEQSSNTFRNLKGHNAVRKALEYGKINKIKYAAGTMGLESVLSSYGSITETLTSPAEILLTDNLFGQGLLVSTDWQCENVYMPGDIPAGAGAYTHAWKIVPKKKSASFCFLYPPEYKFNLTEYRYMKFRVHSPDKSVFDPGGTVAHNFKRLWFRSRNGLWGHTPVATWDSNNDEHNADREKGRIADNLLGTWIDYTYDLYDIIKPTDAHPWYNIIVINIGGEPGTDPPAEYPYYFLDIRWSKTP